MILMPTQQWKDNQPSICAKSLALSACARRFSKICSSASVAFCKNHDNIIFSNI